MATRNHPFLSDPIERRRIIIVGVAAILALSSNVIGLLYGITTVFPHLIYFPIIIAGYWYPRRGPFVAFLIAIIYCIPAYLLMPQDLFTTAYIIARGTVYVIIGVIISLLAIRMRQSEQKLHDLIEFLPDATFAIDQNGTVIAWNRAIEEMTGIPKMKMIGKGGYAYSVPFYAEKRPILIDCAMNPGIEAKTCYPAIRRRGDMMEAEVIAPALHDGKGAHLKIAATPFYDTGNAIVGAVESIRDITEEVRIRSALQNSNRQLTALSGIIRHGLSERLEELYRHLTIGSIRFDDPPTLTFLEEIEKAADGIRRQIVISRDFREIGSRPSAWMPVQETIAGVLSRIDAGGITVYSWTERLEIFADPHLPAAFTHLIENAAAAGATALVITYQIREGECFICFEDNGPGIPDDARKRLFSEGTERSGQGLFLTREILAITGITIHEEGREGIGARFVMVVPPEGYRIT
ncbi:PAS domain S-box protein [Methanocalculus sp.]|uniref:PAS domain S-box protein n=1 Tax=Methanocalculus sp. TaxID=2004547 RepID=UPI002601A0B5|nr:PAS domain S-box protein [Methanocalculus sp.]MDG6251153.1 PAS domain S-box protein [Methanocalculus sp.]